MVRDMAALRVVDHHHHHEQLRGHVHGLQDSGQRQDHPVAAAGGARAGLHGHLHCGDVHQDHRHGLHPPRELLPPQHVEHHGLCGGGLRVSFQTFIMQLLMCQDVLKPFPHSMQGFL